MTVNPTPHHLMWELQEQFRLSLDRATDRATDQIGAIVSADALLVGFLADDVTVPGAPDVCIAPADRGFSIQDLEGIFGQGVLFWPLVHEGEVLVDIWGPQCQPCLALMPAEQVARMEEMARINGLDPARLDHFLDETRREAVAAALDSGRAGRGRTFFIGSGARVGDYVVHPAISVDSSAYAELNALPYDEIDGVPLTTSLAHGIVVELLRIATHALLAARPPRSISPIDDDVPNDAIRRSANHLVYSAAHGLRAAGAAGPLPCGRCRGALVRPGARPGPRRSARGTRPGGP